MKSILLKQTRTLADEIQTQAIKALSLEPEVMKRFSNELVQLRKDLKFRYSPPLEKLMIEQVLAAHAQSMVALYKLETFPINVEVKNDRRYLEERANGTHMRLCRSIAVLAGLRRMGMRQGQYEAGGLGERQHFPPGMRPAQQFSESEWKGSSVDYLDEDETSEQDRQRNAAIRQYWADREARWQAYRETEEDSKPRRLVRLVYKAVERRESGEA